jgi:hypothetical protein
MPFNSRTFRTRTGAKSAKSDDIQRATTRHKEAMKTVVEQAGVIAKESLIKIATIQDPNLRRSARR